MHTLNWHVESGADAFARNNFRSDSDGIGRKVKSSRQSRKGLLGVLKTAEIDLSRTRPTQKLRWPNTTPNSRNGM